MRHGSFPIDTYAAEEWSRCMRLALAANGVSTDLAAYLDRELTNTAIQLRNKSDEGEQ
jgi:truncated hemoglobin YjbI